MTDGNDLLDQAYENFRSGDLDASRSAAEQALSLGTSRDDPDTVGGALTALCRVALRQNEAARIDALTKDLVEMASSTGNGKWRVYATHMRAELARMNGNLDAADGLYSDSLELSKALGLDGMVAAENFNRSFVSAARGELESAREQVHAYFTLTAEMNDGAPDAYGLIALANLLAAEVRLDAAAIVAFAARHLFEDEGIVPDPADEAPLLAVETTVSGHFSESQLAVLRDDAAAASLQQIVDSFL